MVQPYSFPTHSNIRPVNGKTQIETNTPKLQDNKFGAPLKIQHAPPNCDPGENRRALNLHPMIFSFFEMSAMRLLFASPCASLATSYMHLAPHGHSTTQSNPLIINMCNITQWGACFSRSSLSHDGIHHHWVAPGSGPEWHGI